MRILKDMIETFVNNNYRVVKIKIEEANLNSAEEFRQEVHKLIDEGSRYLMIDFSEVVYLDSTFMAALVSLLKYAMSKKGDIAVAGLNKDLYNLFEIIRMDKIFSIYPALPDSFTGSFGR